MKRDADQASTTVLKQKKYVIFYRSDYLLLYVCVYDSCSTKIAIAIFYNIYLNVIVSFFLIKSADYSLRVLSSCS